MLITLINNNNLTIEIRIIFDRRQNNNQIDTISTIRVDKIAITIR